MAQEERKAKAVLAAAQVWAHADDVHARDRETMGAQPLEEKALRFAIAEYEAVKSAEPPKDPLSFRCPHCDAERPSYGWDVNAGQTPKFSIAWLTCFCGECKAILGTAVTTFAPTKEFAQEMLDMFQGRATGKPS
jgi:hypothetical protein